MLWHAAGALVIWLVVSAGAFVALGLYSFAATHTVDDDPPVRFETATAGVAFVALLHLLASGVLVIWAAKAQSNRSLR